MIKTKFLALALLLIGTAVSPVSAKEYKAALFGVKSDGTTNNTRSIQKAVDFISENGGGELAFYVGRYLTGTIHLKSNVTIVIKEGAALTGASCFLYQRDYEGGLAECLFVWHLDCCRLNTGNAAHDCDNLPCQRCGFDEQKADYCEESQFDSEFWCDGYSLHRQNRDTHAG